MLEKLVQNLQGSLRREFSLGHVVLIAKFEKHVK